MRKKKKHPQWIPASERLPDTRGRYLVFGDNPLRGSSQDISEWYPPLGNWAGNWAGNRNVTHWMPLPIPPAN